MRPRCRAGSVPCARGAPRRRIRAMHGREPLCGRPCARGRGLSCCGGVRARRESRPDKSACCGVVAGRRRNRRVTAACFSRRGATHSRFSGSFLVFPPPAPLEDAFAPWNTRRNHPKWSCRLFSPFSARERPHFDQAAGGRPPARRGRHETAGIPLLCRVDARLLVRARADRGAALSRPDRVRRVMRQPADEPSALRRMWKRVR